MSGETKGAREAIDRMTKSIVESSRGQVSPDKARDIARDAAIRSDRKKKR
jgi:hypothetical protein